MRTAVYSGSFDPLHIGHLAILRSLCESALYDRVLLVISPQNPFKDPSRAANARLRFEAAKSAVARYPELAKVEVSDIELGMEPPHYTLKTLELLHSLNPEDSFTLVIGADNLASMRRWYEYGRLLLEYGVIVFPRDSYDIAELRAELLAENGAYRIATIDAPLVNVSSTYIRESIALGRDVGALLM